METMQDSVETSKKMDVDSDINGFIKFANQSMPDRSVPFKQFFSPKATKEFKDPDNKQLVSGLIFHEHCTIVAILY